MRVVMNFKIIHAMGTNKLEETVDNLELRAPTVGRRRREDLSKKECVKRIIDHVLSQYPEVCCHAPSIARSHARCGLQFCDRHI